MADISFQKVQKFAQMSLDAYLPLDEIRDKYKNSILAAGEEKQHDIRYFLIEQDGEAYLSFRGTADLENALTDAEYALHFDKELGVYLHDGFQAAYHSAMKGIQPKIDTIIQNGTGLNITGHSLGGAVAAIALIHLSQTKANIKSTITFGQPKVTGKKGVARFNSLDLLRVVDEEDLVPLVPPNTLLSEIHGGYRHFGRELLLLEGIHYSLLEEREAEQSKVSSFWRNIGHERLKDHYMANYMKRIDDKILKNEEVPYSEHKKFE